MVNPNEINPDIHAPESILVIVEWLSSDQCHELDDAGLIAGLGRRLRAAGPPVDRISLHLRTLHPEFLGRTLAWAPNEPVEIHDREHGIEVSQAFMDSPVAQVLETGQPLVVRRVDDDEAAWTKIDAAVGTPTASPPPDRLLKQELRQRCRWRKKTVILAHIRLTERYNLLSSAHPQAPMTFGTRAMTAAAACGQIVILVVPMGGSVQRCLLLLLRPVQSGVLISLGHRLEHCTPIRRYTPLCFSADRSSLSARYSTIRGAVASQRIYGAGHPQPN